MAKPSGAALGRKIEINMLISLNFLCVRCDQSMSCAAHDAGYTARKATGMRNINMTSKTLLTAFGLVALLATPALAQKPVHHHHYRYASGPYASVAASPAAIEEGHSVGTDPDPSIRSELQRDWQTSLGAN